MGVGVGPVPFKGWRSGGKWGNTLSICGQLGLHTYGGPPWTPDGEVINKKQQTANIHGTPIAHP